jgi:hypothetical protein
MRFDLLIKSNPEFSAAKPIARFNIAAIIFSLEQTQRQFTKINNSLNVRRSQLTSEAVANMVEGYRFIDQLLAQGTDLMAKGNSSLLLEVNTLVLCGSDQKKREDFIFHIEKNKEYFYDHQQGGIGSLMEWNDLHQSDNIWKKAAGLYTHIMSRPQLFFEGNHRSAILIVSFLLGREGYPPFVLTPINAKPLFDQSRQLSDLRKNSLRALIQLPKLRNQLSSTFKETLEQRHVL